MRHVCDWRDLVDLSSCNDVLVTYKPPQSNKQAFNVERNECHEIITNLQQP